MATGDDNSIELVVRDLRTGGTEPKRFHSLDEACSWLRERPPMIEVLGATHPMSEEVTTQLREAIRPLDELEDQASEELDEQDSEFAEATRQIERAVARGFMLENRWPGGFRYE